MQSKDRAEGNLEEFYGGLASLERRRNKQFMEARQAFVSIMKRDFDKEITSLIEERAKNINFGPGKSLSVTFWELLSRFRGSEEYKDLVKLHPMGNTTFAQKEIAQSLFSLFMADFELHAKKARSVGLDAFITALNIDGNMTLTIGQLRKETCTRSHNDES